VAAGTDGPDGPLNADQLVVLGLAQDVPHEESLPWETATAIPTTATKAAPPIKSRFGLRAAWRTPAGLPGASAPSAAKAPETDKVEPVIAAATVAAIIAVRILVMTIVP